MVKVAIVLMTWWLVLTTLLQFEHMLLKFLIHIVKHSYDYAQSYSSQCDFRGAATLTAYQYFGSCFNWRYLFISLPVENVGWNTLLFNINYLYPIPF